MRTNLTTLAIFDGLKIPPSTLQLELSYIVALYIPNAYKRSLYQLTLRLVNLYYKTTLLYGQIKYKNTSLHENYKNKS